jgi:hypothetical protein
MKEKERKKKERRKERRMLTPLTGEVWASLLKDKSSHRGKGFAISSFSGLSQPPPQLNKEV